MELPSHWTFCLRELIKVELGFSFLAAESILGDTILQKVAEWRQVKSNAKAANRSQESGEAEGRQGGYLDQVTGFLNSFPLTQGSSLKLGCILCISFSCSSESLSENEDYYLVNCQLLV